MFNVTEMRGLKALRKTETTRNMPQDDEDHVVQFKALEQADKWT